MRVTKFPRPRPDEKALLRAALLQLPVSDDQLSEIESMLDIVCHVLEVVRSERAYFSDDNLRKPEADRIALIAATAYSFLTGRTVRGLSNESDGISDLRETGEFARFLAEVLAIVGIKASVQQVKLLSSGAGEAAVEPLERRLGRFKTWCQETLADLQLPTEEGQYCIVGEEEATLDLTELVAALGHKDWSPAYYAAHTLILLNKVRRLGAAGDMDAAIRASIELGEILAEDEYHEMSSIGLRVFKTGQKAAAATWGSNAERLAKREELRRMFEEEREKAVSNEAAYRAVAKRTGVTKRKVRRAVSGY